MRVVVRERAAEQVAAIYRYIAQTNPRAAERMVDRIYGHVHRVALSGFGQLGRPGRRRGTRELVEHPYVIVYRADQVRDELTILAVIHGARRR
jgi:toxin ParE1/3/4